MGNHGGEEIPSGEMGLPDAFLNLQSTLTLNRRARPPPINVSPDKDNSRVPLKDPRPSAELESLQERKIERRQSRGGLRALFTRNKAEWTTTTPIIEDEIPASSILERSRRAVAEVSIKRSLSLRRDKTGETVRPTPATPVRPSSRMRIMSTKPSTKPSPKSTKSSHKSSTRPPTRTSTAWDPPPLFQAYPQAIKHAQLSASTLSADAILRISNHKTSNTLREEIAQARMGNTVDPSDLKHTTKSKSKHRRKISGSLSKADWTQKIFVLVTSGYLLQYAGDGSFDRLPEKMMQLGKDSVAFASDVIPGKHWVLQISQAMDADGTPAADSRSLLSRLAFRGADYRRSATSLLLVFNSPEDMDSWLAVVRREIEALGGKKHVSETGKPKPDDKVMKLEAQPSHRYQVTRDPDQSSIPPSPRLPEFGPPPWVRERDDELQQKLEDAVTSWSSPQLPLFSPSAGEPSVTESVISHGEQQLDGLRDASNRYSYMSSGQRTLITTEGSTPASSPTRATTPGFDEPLKIEPVPIIEEARPRPNASAISQRRRSMQAIHVPSLDVPPAPKHYRHSTYAGPPRNIRINTGMTPNFSVPNSSSRHLPTQKVTLAEKILEPTTGAPTPLRTKESILKGMRKITTQDNKDSRPLSPVRDASPKSIDSSTANQELDASNIQLPPTKPTRSKSEPDAPQANRRSNLIPLQLPRKVGMQPLRETKSHHDMKEAALQDRDVLRPLPIPSEALRKQHRESTIGPIPVLANTKSKMRRPMSMQVSTTPFVRSPPFIKSPTLKPTTPPGTFTLFPPSQQARPNSSRSVSPALEFNESSGLLTPVTVLSPPISVQKTTSISHDNETRSSPISQSQKPKLSQTSSHDNSSRTSLLSQRQNQKPKMFQNSSDKNSARRGSKVLSPLPSSSMQTHAYTQRPKEGTSGTLNNRRSMSSMLVNGPPPAPPPECALPPLPPGTRRRESQNQIRSLRI